MVSKYKVDPYWQRILLIMTFVFAIVSQVKADPLGVGMEQCQREAAECGVVIDRNGDTVECGVCGSGESCVANRCESSCDLSQLDKGPMDSLLLYLPNQYSDSDHSPLQHVVSTQLFDRGDINSQVFPFASRTDMTHRQLTVGFNQVNERLPLTFSVKLMPAESQQEKLILANNQFELRQMGSELSAQLLTANGWVNLVIDQSQLKTKSCNHVAITIEQGEVTSYFNGVPAVHSINTQGIALLDSDLVVGRYPGKVWDLRIYGRTLETQEMNTLAEDCADELLRAPAFEGYPNYLCAVYQCIWWPDGVTDTSFESFQYQVNAHDMTWEHNVLATGMHEHGNVCGEIEKPRDLKLDEGYRKSWVSRFNEDKPWNHYVLHENFHAFQKRAGRGSKFLLESTANWGAYAQKPGDDGVKLLGMYTLQPHLPLYATQSSPIQEGIIDAYKGGHQYGAGIYHYYLTRYVVGKKLIGDIFNDPRRFSEPVAVMYDSVASVEKDMRDVFAEFAARTITWDYPDHSEEWRQAEINSYGRMVKQNKGPDGDPDNPWPDDEVDNKIAVFYGVEGTGAEWQTVPERYRPGNWAYNAYEVDVTQDEVYRIGIRPAATNPDYAEFRAKVVRHNPATDERHYYELDTVGLGESTTLNVSAKAGEKLYLVVASTPSTQFKGWDVYSYDYLIEAGADDTDNGGSDNGDDNGDGTDDGNDDGELSPLEKFLKWLKSFFKWLSQIYEDLFGDNSGGDDGDNNSGGDDDNGSGGDDSSNNHAPVVSNSLHSVDAGNSITITLEATDEDGDNLSYFIVTQPDYGQITLEGATVTYQADANYVGNDKFTFKANDGIADSNIGEISISVNEVVDDTPKAKVFLMGGQSNMVGYGSNSALEDIDASLLEARDDVFIEAIISPNRSFNALRPGYGFRSSHFGVELKMGHVLGEAIDDPVYLFKAAKGGTTLADVSHWRPLAYGGTDNNLYDQMITGFNDFLATDLAGKEYEIAGFIWFQGYNDTFGTEHEYEGHLRNLISAVRTDLNQPELPVVIVQINDVRGAAGDVVMNAQAKVAQEDPLASLVITGDQRPYYHYGSDSYVVIGDRIAQALMPHLNRPQALHDTYNVTPEGELSVSLQQGVFSNDSGDNLFAEIVQQPLYGDLTLDSNGSFIYRPFGGFVGRDRFSYRAKSGSKASNVAQVNLWVRDTTDPLVLHYDFEQSDKEAILDIASGIQAKVVRDGVVLGQPGRDGNGIYFNGEGTLHYLTEYPAYDFLSLSTDNDFSFAAWVKLDGAVNAEQIIVTNKYYYGRNGGFALTTTDDGNSIKAFISAYDHEQHKYSKVVLEGNDGNLNDGQWHHVVMSVAFSKGELSLYVDGSLVGQTDISHLQGDINKFESAIGDGAGGGDGKSTAFKGYMDELRFYRQAITQEHVHQLAQ